MSLLQNLTESELKKKIIRITSRKKDHDSQNKENISCANTSTINRKLCLEPSQECTSP